MDTPERNQISAPTPLSKFEDSPVFNYINSLSPIQPVRSTHIAQSFNSLTFASPPSVFTSPHVSSHKESRFLKRHQNPDPSKPEFSSENDGKVCSSDGVMDSTQLRNPLSNIDPGEDSTEKCSVEPPSVHPKSAIELPKTLKYDCGSPNINPVSCGVETNSAPGLADASTSLVKKASEKASSEGDVNRQETSQSEQEREGTTYEWESLISDASDLLIFNSPDNTEAFKELMQKSLDRGRRFCSSLVSQCTLDNMNAVQSTLLVDSDGSVQHYGTDGPSSQPGEASEAQLKNDLDNTCLKQCMVSNPNDKMDNEPISNLHRGMRRRCLDFEMAGAHRKNLNGSLHCKSSLLSQFDEKIALSDQSVSIKPSGDSLRRILPGIGLHLNALATASKDYKSLKCETLSSGRQIINLSGSVASFDSSTANQEPLPKVASSSIADRDQDAAEDGVQTMEDASGVSAYLLTEDFNQNSPKKKRRRLEQATETESSCKRCNCKKSKCLKLYCECFAAGVYCIEPCSCQDCFNKPIHEDTVLATRKQIESRNPLAFAPKVIRSSDSVPEIGDESSKTPASARHKRGCNCKKSSCLKKYCECYQGGVGCSINCRCEGCKNSFGRKDGCTILGTEGEQEEEESELFDKSVVDKALQKTEIQHNEDHKSTSVVPMTPLQLYRPLIQLPFSSKSKPPRCTFPAIGSTSGSFSSQKFGRPSIIRSQPKFEKQSQSQTQTGAEDEMPEILRENSSPNGGVKTGSPNSKRVSPPHCNFGSSSPGSGRRSGRKLILQSIPSFPSLTPQH